MSTGWKARVCLLISLVILFASHAQSSGLPIEISSRYRILNIPFVSIRICKPNSNECQVIDRIMLDTASVGLRVFASLLPFELPQEFDANGKPLAECQAFGGGNSDWGPIRLADVYLGLELAKNLPLQLIDSQYAQRPQVCLHPSEDPDSAGINGVLGIATSQNDKKMGNHYYSCNENSCSRSEPKLATQYTANPISRLAHNNNGYTIEFPTVGASSSAVHGFLSFGIGTPNNNGLSAKVKTLITRPGGKFDLTYKGHKYWSFLDTGTNSYSLPSDISILHCPGQVYLCPQQATGFSVQLWSADLNSAQNAQVLVAALEPMDWNSIFVQPNLGEAWGGAMAQGFVLGVPFFFGKRVFFAIDGMPNPMGSRSFVGFQDISILSENHFDQD